MEVLLNRRRFLGLSGAALVGGAPDAWPEWAKRIPPLMEETKVPGVSVAIVKDGKLGWQKGFGVKEGAVFEAASMSKPVFAYAVMKLCERGVLNLDTPLTKYTPDRFLADDPRLDLITARHVLSHTSGFQNTRSGREPLRIHFAPGEKWMYSGEGFAYLQSVVTQLTGHVDPKVCGQYEAGLEVCATDFDAYMKANLLAPFGMKSSGYRGTHAVARYGAMGGLLTTAEDYAKFLMEVCDPKPSDKFRLSAASHKEMLRPQIKVSDGDGYSIWWALGWRIARTANGDLVSHGGDNAGFHSTAEFCLKDRSGFVILTNSDGGVELIKRLAPQVSRELHGSPKA